MTYNHKFHILHVATTYATIYLQQCNKGFYLDASYFIINDKLWFDSDVFDDILNLDKWDKAQVLK